MSARSEQPRIEEVPIWYRRGWQVDQARCRNCEESNYEQRDSLGKTGDPMQSLFRTNGLTDFVSNEVSAAVPPLSLRGQTDCVFSRDAKNTSLSEYQEQRRTRHWHGQWPNKNIRPSIYKSDSYNCVDEMFHWNVAFFEDLNQLLKKDVSIFKHTVLPQ